MDNQCGTDMGNFSVRAEFRAGTGIRAGVHHSRGTGNNRAEYRDKKAQVTRKENSRKRDGYMHGESFFLDIYVICLVNAGRTDRAIKYRNDLFLADLRDPQRSMETRAEP